MKYSYSVKSIFILLITLLGSTSFFSCTKEFSHNVKPYYDSVLNLSVEQIKDFYTGKDVLLDEDKSFQAVYISGVVITDASAGNQPDHLLFIQDGKVGIGIKLKDSANLTKFKLGDLVQVDVDAGMLTKIDGNIVIAGISSSDFSIQQSGKTVKPNKITLKTLNKNFDIYAGSLVQIASAEVKPEPATGETFSGNKSLDDGSVDPGLIQLYTKAGSDLANDTVPDQPVTYTGIALYMQDQNSDSVVKRISLRNASDIGITKLISMNADIIITGFMSNPDGSDEPADGGGFEYIQLMALKDIDFSQTNYCVVVCNNGSAGAGGWAEGGKTTYKFNLTEGTAKQGTFFYVGATGKRIDGDGSTDISNANWIRTINVVNTSGDGFGSPTNSVLQNNNGGTGSADGMAVFKGTTVTADSIPMDAVFYNPPINNALKDPYGYQLPNSDLYHRQHPTSGADQYLFGQGSNTTTVEGAGLSAHFAIFGGVITKRGWLVPRTPATKILNSSSKLSDIEAGAGITVFRK